MAIYEFLEDKFQILIMFSSLLIELIGVLILLITVFSCVAGLIRKTKTIQSLFEGISMTLAFFMGGEVLRTLTTHETQALITLAAIVILRAAMTFILHWEMQHEKEAEDLEKKDKKDKKEIKET